MTNKIKLTANILFSGIGCQEIGIVNTNLFDLQVNCTSDIYKEAVLSYVAVHHGLTTETVENYKHYPPREQMAQELTDINLGYVPEKDKHYDWFKLAKRKNKDLEKFWLANKLSKNLGDINKIKELPYADLWTCSFPCTDLSICGKMKGLSPDSGTRSSLLWQQIRLLKTAKENGTLPKYILFENVKNLVSKKFINDFNSLLEILNELSFNTYWKILNAKNCGIPQNRERVFVVCIRKDIDTGKFEFPKPFDNGLRLKDLLEEEVDEKYYLSDTVQNRFKCTDKEFKKNIIGTTKPEQRTIGQRDLVYNPNGVIGSLVATDYKQPKQIVGNNYMEHNFRIRKLTPTEYWKLMGLHTSDCDKARAVGITDTHLYKQAGNGIVTNCVELIFEHLYKAMYDENYVCGDEKYSDNVTENHCIQAGNLSGGKWDKMMDISRRYYSPDGVAPTVHTCGGGNQEPKIIEEEKK